MTSPRMRRLVTKRLILEPQVAAHAAEMFRVLSEPALYEFENAPPTSAEVLHERFTKLESRRSPDGRQQWLNWVMRLRGDGLVGFVQATVFPDRSAGIAYVRTLRCRTLRRRTQARERSIRAASRAAGVSARRERAGSRGAPRSR